MENNEGEACDAVLRSLEHVTGQLRAGVWCSEKAGAVPPVELRFRLGNRHYAMEHTRIEAFDHQIQTGVRFAQLIEPVTKALSGKLPGEAIYEIHFPLHTSLRVNATRLKELRSNLSDWVWENATLLHEKSCDAAAHQEKSRRSHSSISGTPPGFNYEVTLHRWRRRGLARREEGWLGAARVAPENMEPSRTSRLRKALDDKRGKLQECKRQDARTILVMESDDIALSNHVVTGEALLNALEGRMDTADEIYLVETLADPWIVRTLKRNNECWPKIVEDYQQFNVGDLIDLTAQTAKHKRGMSRSMLKS